MSLRQWLSDRPRRELAEDVTLAVAFFVIAQLDVWTLGTVPGPHLPNALILAFVAPPLAWRRRAPCAALTVTCAAVIVQVLAIPGKPPSGFLTAGPILIGAYSVGAYATESRPWVVAVAVALVCFDVIFGAAQGLNGTFSQLTSDAMWLALPLALWAVGSQIRRRRQAAAARAATIAAERRRERQQLAALEHERARMARELHDVLAHSVSLMGVQAGAAEQVLARDPERTRPVLRSIQQTSRESVAELRRLLGMLRSDDLEPELESDLAPQPRLDQLGALVARMREAGLPVALSVQGDERVLPAGVELAAYRVIQESLTNALKHARPSRVDVRLRFDPGLLEISVRNDGARSNGDGGGHGLLGMNERVALYGGTLTAGARADGDFHVDARIPIEAGPA
jgi:signal transduction histidine kinase